MSVKGLGTGWRWSMFAVAFIGEACWARCRISKAHRRPPSSHASSGVLALAGIALLLLPEIASSLAPEVQGNGQHVNESFYAGMRCWIVGLPVPAAGLYRFLLLVLRSAGNPIGQRDAASQDREKITKGQG